MKTTFRTLASAAVLTLSLTAPALAAPLSYPSPPIQEMPKHGSVPSLTAPSWLLYDEAMNYMLASRNINDERSIASITKIMTGLVAIERTEPGDLVTVSSNAAATGEKEIDLVAGETVTMDALFKSLMIHSANDSATAIAEHVGGSVEGFVAMMNDKAAELGMTRTSFANPHGLDASGHYSTARDMLILTRTAMGDQYFADAVRSTTVVMPPAPDGTERIGKTTNLLLTGADSRSGFPAVDAYEGVIGVKTGFTLRAQNTYVSAAERDGRRLYAIVLGSDGPRSHLFEVENLFDYGFANYPMAAPIAEGTPYVSVKPRITPDPLFVQGDMETYVHIAGQGLVLAVPTPPINQDGTDVVPLPITELSRTPETGPTSAGEGLAYWFTLLFGG
jgi:D-alanyl-D-alanine carboxypeptidase